MGPIQTDTGLVQEPAGQPVPVEIDALALGLLGRDTRLRQLANIGSIEPEIKKEKEWLEL